MIIGIGIDSVRTARFLNWHTYSQNQLNRILSEDEISYCTNDTKKSARRFASHFAAREALFKAASSALPEASLNLLATCKQIKLTHTARGAPILTVDWQKLLGAKNITTNRHLIALISITHTETTTTAIVLIQKL